MSLTAQITDDMKSALKAGDKDRLKVLRLVLADIKRAEVDGRTQLDDAAVLSVLEKAAKQRRDSIEQFTSGGRLDLAAGEQAELEVIQTYLPAQLTDDELEALLSEVIAETGAGSMRDMGKVMSLLKTRAAGKADMSAVSARVKARLA